MEDDDFESGSAGELTCGSCGESGSFTAPVAVLLVYAPGLERPYPLIPAEDYRICQSCDAVFALVERAVEAHKITAAAGPWTRAVLLFIDGQGMDVTAQREAPSLHGKMALA